MKRRKKVTLDGAKPAAAEKTAAAEVSTAAPVLEEPIAAPAPEEPIPAPVPEEAAAEPEKKPARRARKPKAEAAEKAPRQSRRTKAAEEKQPEKTPIRRSKVDIPPAVGLFVQYQGGEVDMAAVAESAKAEFKAAHKRGRITTLKIYLKPEEHVAYYVINDDFQGQISL